MMRPIEYDEGFTNYNYTRYIGVEKVWEPFIAQSTKVDNVGFTMCVNKWNLQNRNSAPLNYSSIREILTP